ncbi:uncharacterized protein [Cicer arietinum]|uniref:Exportin-7-like n=1 Tax=Cicer arietinum TaxID=3827 RepID=A0A1S3EIQ9_CICAR|nr:exportin-7-like [Cicer arietinum]
MDARITRVEERLGRVEDSIESLRDFIGSEIQRALTAVQDNITAWAGSSVYYLLNLWSKSVTSVRYLKSDKPNLLEEYVPKVIECFVSSRFDSLQSELSDELGEDPLDNVEVLQDQLEFFPYLCRFQYEGCSSYLMKIVEPIMQSYMKEANLQIPMDSYELSITESKLAWFTHIVAAILKTKQMSGFSGESHEILDAEISACVLQLVNISDSGIHNKVYEYSRIKFGVSYNI